MAVIDCNRIHLRVKSVVDNDMTDKKEGRIENEKEEVISVPHERRVALQNKKT